MPNKPVFQPTMMALSVAMALAAPWAQAATFEGSIQGGSTVLSNSAAAANVSDNALTSNSARSSYEGDVSSGTSRVSAISDGNFYNTIDTVLTFRQAVTNPFSTTQAVSFDFHIPRSRTIIDLGWQSNIKTFSAASSFTGTISWGGVTLWSATYGVRGSGDLANGGGTIQGVGPTLSASASGFTVEPLVSSGISVNSYNDQDMLAGGGYITSKDYQGTLQLGHLANGETKDLVYTLSAHAQFEATYIDSSSSSAYGYGGYAQAGGFDPFGINFAPDPNGAGAGVALSFTTAVPEPQSYALMLGGLALLATHLRRRKQAGASCASTAVPPQAEPLEEPAARSSRC